MKKTNALTWGLLIIFLAIALVALSDLLGFLKANNIFGMYWPILLVIIGVFSLGTTASANAFGLGMASLGILLTLRNLGIFASQSGGVIFIVLICLLALAVLAISTGKKPTNPS
jgi:hypothetical protein